MERWPLITTQTWPDWLATKIRLLPSWALAMASAEGTDPTRWTCTAGAAPTAATIEAAGLVGGTDAVPPGPVANGVEPGEVNAGRGELSPGLALPVAGAEGPSDRMADPQPARASATTAVTMATPRRGRRAAGPIVRAAVPASISPSHAR